MHTMTRLAAGTVAWVMLYASALAHDIECARPERLRATLMEHYGERVIATGRVSPEIQMELFASPAGTWTVLITSARGDVSCIAATGDAWSSDPSAILPWGDPV